MNTHVFKLTLCALAALFFAGCGITRPKPDSTQYYMLAIGKWIKPDEAPYKNDLNIAVQRCDFSEYLDNSQIATRPSREQVVYSPYHRWAEPLAGGLTRTLVVNLSTLMDNPIVLIYPNRISGFKPDVVVYTHVVTFDGEIGKDCRLALQWRITSGDGLKLLLSDGAYKKAPSGDSYASYVKALSELWDWYGDTLAQQIVQLQKEGKISTK